MAENIGLFCIVVVCVLISYLFQNIICFSRNLDFVFKVGLYLLLYTIIMWNFGLDFYERKLVKQGVIKIRKIIKK